jgi:lysylphosphatidylglycerol synthetase-like protein (DUF2156 family)
MAEQPAAPAPAQPRPPRPLGVTVVAILQILGGILLVLGGAALAALPQLVELPLPGFGLLFGGLGALLIIIGILALLVGWGLWAGKGWAWWLTVILQALGIVSSLASLALGDPTAIASLIIAAIILYYFFKPHVKAYFGVKVGFST